ncbi:MAG: PIN domain-containing protein [Burkholderiales bacterium]|nr:PIN domain-containing protein [Burkholderiales bacterium]MDE1927429.1 PIN domain-containing protein [Burkholderiales bacterium]MDE2158258.1 PIN domain-containing protein [Burkholderiales bacterium]MDE2504791.1 PIN domain-containing protein [Burkholderiales bacterium]
MSAVFVDTPVLLAAFDDAAPERRARAREWLGLCWQNRCGRLSSQVLHEFYANARRRFASAIAAGDARAEVRRYQLWKPWLVDQATVETAWAVESRYDIGYWQAMKVAAAQHMGCRWLLSEELPHEQRFEQLCVVNPYVAGPGTVQTEARP